MTASAAPAVLATAHGVTARTVTVRHIDALLLDCSGPALTWAQRAILRDACDAIREGDRSATCVVVAARLVAEAAARQPPPGSSASSARSTSDLISTRHRVPIDDIFVPVTGCAARPWSRWQDCVP
jgi:hypothetical protein